MAIQVDHEELSALRWACKNLTAKEVRDLALKLTNRHLPYQYSKPKLQPFRVAVIVGHNEKQQGAYSQFLGQSEFVFNNKVADAMVSLSNSEVIYEKFNRIYRGSYATEIREVYSKAKAFNPDLNLELHFNAGGGDFTMMLTAHNSSPSYLAAAALNKEMERLGMRDHGVQFTGRTDRGGRGLYETSVPTVLTEPFFGDNPLSVDTIWSHGGEHAIANANHRGVLNAKKTLQYGN